MESQFPSPSPDPSRLTRRPLILPAVPTEGTMTVSHLPPLPPCIEEPIVTEPDQRLLRLSSSNLGARANTIDNECEPQLPLTVDDTDLISCVPNEESYSYKFRKKLDELGALTTTPELISEESYAEVVSELKSGVSPRALAVVCAMIKAADDSDAKQLVLEKFVGSADSALALKLAERLSSQRPFERHLLIELLNREDIGAAAAKKMDQGLASQLGKAVYTESNGDSLDRVLQSCKELSEALHLLPKTCTALSNLADPNPFSRVTSVASSIASWLISNWDAEEVVNYLAAGIGTSAVASTISSILAAPDKVTKHGLGVGLATLTVTGLCGSAVAVAGCPSVRCFGVAASVGAAAYYFLGGAGAGLEPGSTGFVLGGILGILGMAAFNCGWWSDPSPRGVFGVKESQLEALTAVLRERPDLFEGALKKTLLRGKVNPSLVLDSVLQAESLATKGQESEHDKEFDDPLAKGVLKAEPQLKASAVVFRIMEIAINSEDSPSRNKATNFLAQRSWSECLQKSVLENYRTESGTHDRIERLVAAHLQHCPNDSFLFEGLRELSLSSHAAARTLAFICNENQGPLE